MALADLISATGSSRTVILKTVSGFLCISLNIFYDFTNLINLIQSDSQKEIRTMERRFSMMKRPIEFRGGSIHMMIRAITVIMVILLAALPASAQLDRIFKGLGIGQKGGLSDAKIGSGLKEALKMGTENAVGLTGKTDGYFLNQAIKILMPEKLRTLEKGLRVVGYGPQVDEFVLSMNRAAEQAAPAAKQIFWDAIGEMTFEDAKKILSGNETAATDYFKAKTTNKLTTAFTPIVGKATNEGGVTRKYKAL